MIVLLCCSLVVDCRSSCVAHWLLSVCCVLRVMCCVCCVVLCAGCCLVFLGLCFLYVICCSVSIVYCILFDARCVLRVGLISCFLTLCIIGAWSMALVSHFLCLDYCFVCIVPCVLLHV